MPRSHRFRHICDICREDITEKSSNSYSYVPFKLIFFVLVVVGLYIYFPAVKLSINGLIFALKALTYLTTNAFQTTTDLTSLFAGAIQEGTNLGMEAIDYINSGLNVNSVLAIRECDPNIAVHADEDWGECLSEYGFTEQDMQTYGLYDLRPFAEKNKGAFVSAHHFASFLYKSFLGVGWKYRENLAALPGAESRLQ